jgi:hypothetical protein
MRKQVVKLAPKTTIAGNYVDLPVFLTGIIHFVYSKTGHCLERLMNRTAGKHAFWWSHSSRTPKLHRKSNHIQPTASPRRLAFVSLEMGHHLSVQKLVHQEARLRVISLQAPSP